jgi:ATP-binding cassette subfamily B protein
VSVPRKCSRAIGVQGSISGLITSLAQLAQSMLLFGHYYDVVSIGPDLPLAGRPRPLPALRQGIEVRDVWFRYDDERPRAAARHCGRR